MERIDLDQDIVRAVAKNIPCIHMNTDFLAANAVSVFLKYLRWHQSNGSSLEEAISDIKLKNVE